MTEHDLTALAKQKCQEVADGDYFSEYEGSSDKLAAGYLALLTERDNLKRLLAAVAAERDALRKESKP